MIVFLLRSLMLYVSFIVLRAYLNIFMVYDGLIENTIDFSSVK